MLVKKHVKVLDMTHILNINEAATHKVNVAKILLAVRDDDSINKVSEKIGSSYSYTCEWIERLEEAEVLKRDNGIRIMDEEFI